MTGPAYCTETTYEPHRDLITGVGDRSIRILPVNRAGTSDPAPGAPSLPGAPTNTTTTTRQDPKSKIADEVRTLQGAGGVGGLLAISGRIESDAQVGSSGPLDRAAPARPYRHRYPTYDANGNIGQLLDEDGEVVAAYAYDPFGNVTEMAGPEAAENPWRFSTKPVEEVTGWSYYGYRWYDAELGRWVNRDPIEEQGGVNLYGLVQNDPVNATDFLGLDGFSLRLGNPVGRNPWTNCGTLAMFPDIAFALNPRGPDIFVDPTPSNMEDLGCREVAPSEECKLDAPDCERRVVVYLPESEDWDDFRTPNFHAIAQIGCGTNFFHQTGRGGTIFDTGTGSGGDPGQAARAYYEALGLEPALFESHYCCPA